jgi:sialate O-acetylesterase
MILRQPTRILAAAILAASAMLTATSASADVKLPAVLSSHMVLQQGMPVPVWGTADAGEEVTVSFGPQKQTAKADNKGHWEVKLQPLTVSDKPQELTVAGKNKIDLTDVLVGEVWICSGQSNMEFGMGRVRNSKMEIAEANYPHIRLFTVPKTVKSEPASDTIGKWAACTPEEAAHFSAVAYFFGRDLNKDLHVPVGLIHTSWGGTPAEAWTPRSYLIADPDLKPIVDRFDQSIPNYPKAKENYEKKAPKLLADWEAAVAKAKEAHKPLPRKPAPPQDPATSPGGAGHLYNGMIAPIVPFAAKGAIWYQGEANAGRAYQYRKLLPTMIKSWRDAWHEPELDFYIVSLANFQAPATQPGDDDWAELREAQAMTAAMPHNGQALAIDLADAENPSDIHPKNKQDVGHRLELVALARTYGKSVDYSGPEYKFAKFEGSKVVIHFNFAEGLTAKGGEPLKGFQIAGADQKWYWADAKIDGENVIVSSKDVEAPAAVRYDWSHNPQGNLYGKSGLPAVPFRSDDWKGKTADVK